MSQFNSVSEWNAKCSEHQKELHDCITAKMNQHLVVELAESRQREAALVEALVNAVGWMEPVMEGFGIDKKSSGYAVLLNAREAIANFKGRAG